jgi:hypothetical protein
LKLQVHVDRQEPAGTGPKNLRVGMVPMVSAAVAAIRTNRRLRCMVEL